MDSPLFSVARNDCRNTVRLFKKTVQGTRNVYRKIDEEKKTSGDAKMSSTNLSVNVSVSVCFVRPVKTTPLWSHRTLFRSLICDRLFNTCCICLPVCFRLLSRFGIVVEALPPAAGPVDVKKIEFVLLDLPHHLSRLCDPTHGKGHVLLHCHGSRDGDKKTIDLPDGNITLVDADHVLCKQGTGIAFSATTAQTSSSGLRRTVSRSLVQGE